MARKICVVEWRGHCLRPPLRAIPCNSGLFLPLGRLTMSRPTLGRSFCARPNSPLGWIRREYAFYPGLNTLYLVIDTTIRAHSAIIPPAHTYKFSVARGKENIVTQWFELLIGHHHHQAHHRGISIGTTIAPMAWPSRPSRLQERAQPSSGTNR